MNIFNIFKKNQNTNTAAMTPDTKDQLTVQDIIAPEEIEIDFNSLRINKSYYRTYFISAYPRFVEPNWLEPLISFDHSLFISMFIYPSKSKGVLDDLKHKIAEMEATIQTDIQRGRNIDPSVKIALDDARSLQEQLVKGSERFFQLALYITVPAVDKNELKNTTKLVESTLASLSMTAQPTTLQMEYGFKSTIPLGQDLLNLTHNMDTTSLATTFPFASSELTANEGIMYGINEHNDSLILFDRFTLENANSVVFAKSGSGKSVDGDEPVLIQDSTGTHLVKIGQLIDQLIEDRGINFRDEELEGVTEPGIKVLAFDKHLQSSWSSVSIAARKISPKDLYSFQTSSGRQVTTTGDHNLVILRNGKLVVTKSTETKIGDVIPVPRKIPETTTPEECLDIEKIFQQGNIKYTKFRSSKGMRIGTHLRKIEASLPLKVNITSNFAKLLGYITSEGWVGEKYTEVSNTEPIVLSDIQSAVSVIGLNSFIVRKKEQPIAIHISATVFTKLLLAIGAGGRSAEKRIPGFLFNCSNAVIAAYLKAYFEGDGTVGTHEVTATTKSPQLASDLSYLLLRFGIIARIKTTYKKATNVPESKLQPYRNVVISGQENLERFKTDINFVTKRKNNKLAAIMQKTANTNIDTIPELQSTLQKIFDVLYDSPYVASPPNFSPIKSGSFNPSPKALKNLIDSIQNKINSLSINTKQRIEYLKQLPRQSVILESGKLIPTLNTILWQELGQSWRLAKNGMVTMGIGNALKATQIIFNESYDLRRVRKEIISTFSELGISLQQFDNSLWNYLRYRPSDRGSYAKIIETVDYLEQQWRRKMDDIDKLKDELNSLKTLADADLFWDPIISIDKKKATQSYVYDLTVDNEVFLAGTGGMFVHNSYLVKLEALRSLMFGTEIIVIDPEQEYLQLCQAVGGEYINFSASSPVKINPFDLSDIAHPEENELGRKILSLTTFLKIVLGDLDPTESAILDRALKQTYKIHGITDDPKTQNQPPPLMEDLYKVLIGMEEKTAMALAMRLERFIKGSLAGIFSSHSNVHISNSFTVFSIRDLADQLRPLAMYMILDYIWTKVRSQLKKRILVVDEAWYLMRNEDSAAFLIDIAKRARKYYLGLTTITQDVEDFLNGGHGKEIISNSSIQILLKQAPASIEKVGQVFYLSEGEQRLLLASGVGQGLFFAGNTHVAIRVVASPEEHQLITSNPAEILKRQQG